MTNNQQTAAAGEWLVGGMLAYHGWSPTLTRSGFPRTDILAVAEHLANRPMVEIQVKTTAFDSRRLNWEIGGKAHELSESQNEWFVFVALPPDSRTAARFFLVPREHVSAATWIVHMDWLTDSDAPPGKRNAPLSRARIPVRIWESYEGRWDLLELPTDEVDVLLPPDLYAKAQQERVGLPAGHPWHKSLPPWLGVTSETSRSGLQVVTSGRVRPLVSGGPVCSLS